MDSKSRLLIVDDTPDNLRILGEMLEKEDYAVRAANNGLQSLQIAREFIPDLILLDILMPDMDGFEVCRRLKADPNLRGIPVIFLSALDMVDQKLRAFREGGVDYIVKPFASEEVMARVRTHLQMAKLEDYRRALADRTRAEEQLRESERRLSLATHAAHIGIWDWDMERDALVWDESMYRLYGVGKEEFAGNHEAWRHCLHPEDRERTDADIEAARRGEREFSAEFRIVWPDGTIRFIQVNSLIIRDAQGRAVRMIGTNVDTTERRQAEEALRDSENRFRAVFDRAPTGVAILDSGTERFLSVNAAYCVLTGYSEEEMRLHDFASITPSEDQEEVSTNMERLRRGEIPHFEAQTRHIRNDGKTVDVSLCIAPLVWEGARLRQHLAIAADVTERRRLEEQLRQSQKMEAIGQLAGGVAHDFNNILQVVTANMEVFQEIFEPGTPEREAADEVNAAADRAAELTRQLLAFGRRQLIQPTSVDLNELVESAMRMLRRLIGEHISLHFAPRDIVSTVFADKGQIEQVLMNLCVNARDAMGTGGRLTIETGNAAFDAAYCREHSWASEGRYVFFSVADTGPGMSEETLARIFEPFFTTKDVGEGTGLGLATAYGIIKHHKGMIHVYSAPGAGAVFTVYLPVSEQSVQPDDGHESDAVVGGAETILVAEDEPAVLKAIALALGSAGYTVLTAADGNEAVRVIEKRGRGVDLVVLDVMMPGMGGRQVMEHLKAEFPGTRFLFSSGYSESAIHTDFVIHEGVRLIQKPYRRNDLLRAVRRVLDGR